MKKIIICLSTLFVFLFTAEVFAAEEGKEEGRFNPKEAIFSHLGDEYGWSIVLPHGKLLEIPLPVILHGQRGWSVFSSSRLREGKAYEGFYIASSGKYAGKIVGEKNGEEYRPLDVSVTKNVLALFITAVVVMFVLFPLKRWYRRNPLLAPRRGLGVVEMIIDMVYGEVIVPVLGGEHCLKPVVISLLRL